MSCIVDVIFEHYVIAGRFGNAGVWLLCRFLRGTCKQMDGTCPFSHKVSKEKVSHLWYITGALTSTSVLVLGPINCTSK